MQHGGEESGREGAQDQDEMLICEVLQTWKVETKFQQVLFIQTKPQPKSQLVSDGVDLCEDYS